MRRITRLFLASFLVVTFAILGATLSPSISSAEDVWVYGNSDYNVYAVTESYSGVWDAANFSINAKIVYPSGKIVSNKYSFIREGGRFEYVWYCVVNDRDSYKLNLDNDNANRFPYHVSLFRYCVRNFQT